MNYYNSTYNQPARYPVRRTRYTDIVYQGPDRGEDRYKDQ